MNPIMRTIAMISSNKKKSSEEIELRSEKVRNLLGEIPPSLIRWGIVIIVSVFLILLLVVCFMPYPYSNGESILQYIIFNRN